MKNEQVDIPLTIKQAFWIVSEIKEYDIIFLGIHGSHLYGLNREGSDVDIKAVYLPDMNDLLMGNVSKPKQIKNPELDIEMELIPLQSFIRSAEKCDTNVMDMLHTPEHFQLISKPVWKNLVAQRSNLYAKNMKGLVGYIKTHAHKYSNKIQRLEEMKSVLSACNSVDYDLQFKFETVRDLAESISWEDHKYVQKVTLVKDHEQQYLEVCGKKYIYTWSTRELSKALCCEIDRYGSRSNEGIKNGMDTKSLSHALRVLFELREIVEHNTLTFPIENVEYVKAVKLGEVPYEEVMNTIDSLYDECMQLLEDSDLPEEPDVSGMIEELKKYYKEYLNEH